MRGHPVQAAATAAPLLFHYSGRARKRQRRGSEHSKLNHETREIYEMGCKLNARNVHGPGAMRNARCDDPGLSVNQCSLSGTADASVSEGNRSRKNRYKNAPFLHESILKPAVSSTLSDPKLPPDANIRNPNTWSLSLQFCPPQTV